MPANFDKCIKDGGRVTTKNLYGSKYVHVCSINGKSYSGDVKTKVIPKRYLKK